MTSEKNIPGSDELDEGAYTDVETEDGRETHQDDVQPGEYTDVDLGDDAQN